ncbi:MAG TPA: PAS domain S-box protein, partial [Myxococcota bacterium]|nr:PAS domain S-box protein [Myxococcota bacterium]
DGSLRFIEEWGTLERDAAGRPLLLRGISIDVTEREQVASALRESEERLRLSAEAAAIGTFAVDFAAGAIRYSPEACDILGLPRGLEHALTQPDELVHEADRAALRSAVLHALDPRGDRELRGEARISRGDETRWLSFRGRVEFRDEAGSATPSRALGAILDITEQKRALLALRASEEQRRLAFEANRVGTFVAELGKQRVEISSELRALLEIPGDAPVSTQAAMALIEASDLEELRRRFARAIAGEGGGRVSIDIRVGARPRWLAFNAQVEFREDAAGRVPVRVSGVAIDVTERKRAELQLRDGEKLLRAFVNNSAAIAWMKDERGKYVFVSENFQRLLQGGGRALGKSDRELWPEEIASEHARSDRTVLEAFVSREGIERMPAADGGETWWRTAKFPFRDPEGRCYVGGIAVDVSAERRAEEQLREADRRKDRFLATLAHELRSPLAPLLNAAKLLEHEGLPEAELRYCRELIGRQVEQISRLLDDLLDVSRITLGKVALRRRPVELAVVAQRALEMVQPLADTRAHKLEVRLPATPIWLDADLTRLVQVFSNLLGNSVRYTPPGGSITLDAECVGENVRVRVRDDGEGIAPEDLPRIFEMFGTAPGANGRSREGLGIGLALARGLIELHGGQLTGASDGIGRGAEFCVLLPVLMAPPAGVEGSGGRTREPSPARTQPRRVLVADDLRDSADSMTIVLQLA